MVVALVDGCSAHLEDLDIPLLLHARIRRRPDPLPFIHIHVLPHLHDPDDLVLAHLGQGEVMARVEDDDFCAAPNGLTLEHRRDGLVGLGGVGVVGAVGTGSVGEARFGLNKRKWIREQRGEIVLEHLGGSAVLHKPQRKRGRRDHTSPTHKGVLVHRVLDPARTAVPGTEITLVIVLWQLGQYGLLGLALSTRYQQSPSRTPKVSDSTTGMQRVAAVYSVAQIAAQCVGPQYHGPTEPTTHNPELTFQGRFVR